MLFNILMLIVAVVALVLPVVVWRSSRWDRFWNTVGTFVGVVLGGFIVSFIICLIVGGIAGTHEVNTKRTELQAITMGKNIHGSFFLGSGYVDNELTYSFYEKNADGSYHADSLPAESVRIVETGGAPYIQKVTSFLPNWVIPDFDWDSRYVIYVPKGSIKPMINMDLPSN